MGRKTQSDKEKPQGAARKDRLKAALKANLQKRKEQARARTDERTEGKAG